MLFAVRFLVTYTEINKRMRTRTLSNQCNLFRIDEKEIDTKIKCDAPLFTRFALHFNRKNIYIYIRSFGNSIGGVFAFGLRLLFLLFAFGLVYNAIYKIDMKKESAIREHTHEDFFPSTIDRVMCIDITIFEYLRERKEQQQQQQKMEKKLQKPPLIHFTKATTVEKLK